MRMYLLGVALLLSCSSGDSVGPSAAPEGKWGLVQGSATSARLQLVGTLRGSGALEYCVGHQSVFWLLRWDSVDGGATASITYPQFGGPAPPTDSAFVDGNGLEFHSRLVSPTTSPETWTFTRLADDVPDLTC